MGNSPRSCVLHQSGNLQQVTFVKSSTKNMKQRWSKHKGDIRNSKWTACGLTRHFGENHTNNIEEAIRNLKVTLVDCSEIEENLKLLEDRWILKMGTLFTGLNSHNEVLSNRRRNYGKS